MKKGDVIRKEVTYPIGASVYSNFTTKEQGEAWMHHDFLSYYNTSRIPSYHISPIKEGSSQLTILLDEAIIVAQEGVVQWVIEDEVAIKYKDQDGYLIAKVSDNEWKVISESAPSFQSELSAMTDEELRMAIEQSRTQRLVSPTVHKRKTAVAEPKMSEEEQSMTKLLASLSPEKRELVMKKLGLVD